MPNQQDENKETVNIHYHIAGSVNIVKKGIGSNQGEANQNFKEHTQKQIHSLKAQITNLERKVVQLENSLKKAYDELKIYSHGCQSKTKKKINNLSNEIYFFQMVNS